MLVSILFDKWLANEICIFLSLLLFACLLINSSSSLYIPWFYFFILFCTFCHDNHIIPVPPPSPPTFPVLSFVWLAWIKVPMMHGATSTVSSASTPVTNVPFAESAASNQVCSFISVLFYFSSVAHCLFLFSRLKKPSACTEFCSHFICRPFLVFCQTSQLKQEILKVGNYFIRKSQIFF